MHMPSLEIKMNKFDAIKNLQSSKVHVATLGNGLDKKAKDRPTPPLSKQVSPKAAPPPSTKEAVPPTSQMESKKSKKKSKMTKKSATPTSSPSVAQKESANSDDKEETVDPIPSPSETKPANSNSSQAHYTSSFLPTKDVRCFKTPSSVDPFINQVAPSEQQKPNPKVPPTTSQSQEKMTLNDLLSHLK